MNSDFGTQSFRMRSNLTSVPGFNRGAERYFERFLPILELRQISTCFGITLCSATGIPKWFRARTKQKHSPRISKLGVYVSVPEIAQGDFFKPIKLIKKTDQARLRQAIRTNHFADHGLLEIQNAEHTRRAKGVVERRVRGTGMTSECLRGKTIHARNVRYNYTVFLINFVPLTLQTKRGITPWLAAHIRMRYWRVLSKVPSRDCAMIDSSYTHVLYYWYALSKVPRDESEASTWRKKKSSDKHW